MSNSRSTTTRNLDTERATKIAPVVSAGGDVSAAVTREKAIAARNRGIIRENLLDAALEATFPASDPIASMNFTR